MGFTVVTGGDGNTDHTATEVHSRCRSVVTDTQDAQFIGAERATNNTAELTAIASALSYVCEDQASRTRMLGCGAAQSMVRLCASEGSVSGRGDDRISRQAPSRAASRATTAFFRHCRERVHGARHADPQLVLSVSNITGAQWLSFGRAQGLS